MAKNLKTAELERSLISHFFKDPGWLGEVSGMIKSDFFAYIPHQKIFAAIKALYAESKTIDYHILISRLNLMGLTTIEGLETAEYLTAVSQMFVNSDAKKACLDELMKFYWSRQTYKKLIDAQKFIEKSLEAPDLTFSDILNGTEKIVTDALTFESVNGDDSKMVSIYSSGREYVDHAVKNKGHTGIPSPFPRFNDFFGNFYVGGMFMFAARSKVGKSTMLAFLADYFLKTGEGKIKICFCDTEMSPDEVYFRNLSSESGVEEIDIREGTFSENPDSVRKVEQAISKYEEYDPSLFYHIHVPDSPIEEVESIVRRWYSKNVNEGDIAVVIYDYCKMTNDTGDSVNLQEYQIMGKKASQLKNLAKSLPNLMVISSVQLNEQDGVSQSARIKWTTDALFILQKKSIEDFGFYGEKWGTHILYPVVTRKVGRKYKDFHPVKVMEGNKEIYKQNYINLNIDRFKIEERGTFEDALREKGAGQRPIRETASEKQKETLKKYSNF